MVGDLTLSFLTQVHHPDLDTRWTKQNIYFLNIKND